MLLNKLDRYILGRFLGTFLFAIGLIVVVIIVFDLSEKLDDFLANEAPMRAIMLDYYLNFIPYIVNTFGGMFTFVTVIFFTSKMASHSEIIAILSSGVSFGRMMRPYLVGSALLTLVSFLLINWVIPGANARRLEFEEIYYREAPFQNRNRNIHRQIEPGVFTYIQNYNTSADVGYRFTLEEFDQGRLARKITSDYIKWDSARAMWGIHNYTDHRFLPDGAEQIVRGRRMDTLLANFRREDYTSRDEVVQTMDYGELNEAIQRQLDSGSQSYILYAIEKHSRFAFPFSNIILTVIGVCISAKKKRGGIGLNIGLGLGLAFSYLLVMQVTSVFATNAGFDPRMSVWMPNVLYACAAFVLYQRARR